METLCPIDSRYADQIAALLKPPSPDHVQEYFGLLITQRRCHGLIVKANSEYDKGVYAAFDFIEGDLVLKDQMLVGAQHFSNKIDCLVCSFCFRFIGSIELQIGRKLFLQDLGVSANGDCDRPTATHPSDCCQIESSDDEDNSYEEGDESMGGCGPSSSQVKSPLDKEIVQALINGELMLPHSNQFPLPSVITCPGGCREVHYCSKSCAEADWKLFHSLLCTGERSKSSNKEALSRFIQHANETNDIFFLAAKAISRTILKYRELKAAHFEQGKSVSLDPMENCDFSLLLEAWKPLSMGYKRRWWDCIALPDDVDGCDEAPFRLQIKELAFTSLQLLKPAIFDKECELLFSLEIYGHIIGMFELNNLDLVVPSPVEDYFLYMDELPHAEKNKVENITQPFLDSLGDEYSTCCQGSAFFPLQSCMNHSCQPNAKAFKRDEDKDGLAIIIALRPICKGEEVTISYIDEDLPFEERQALLADYGFRCRCSKCLSECP